MKLNLKKDLVFFDIEGTGLSVAKDRIVQLAIIKVFADGSPNIERNRTINPGIPIPKDSTDIHGITDEMVKNEPTFSKVAKGLIDLIGDADLAGFNSNRYDIPLIIEEFARCGITLDMTNRKYVDAWKIYSKMEPRDLKAAVKFYCGKDLENAHDAMADTRATIDVLMAQIEKYEGVDFVGKGDEVIISPVKNDIDALHEFTRDIKNVDFMGKILYNSDVESVFNFGKYKEKPVGEMFAKDPGYYNFVMGGDFATDSKNHFTRLLNEYKLKQKQPV
jgi:DNA polymerase-3 subunit epsilon